MCQGNQWHYITWGLPLNIESHSNDSVNYTAKKAFFTFLFQVIGSSHNVCSTIIFKVGINSELFNLETVFQSLVQVADVKYQRLWFHEQQSPRASSDQAKGKVSPMQSPQAVPNTCTQLLLGSLQSPFTKYSLRKPILADHIPVRVRECRK